ncbi:MAG: Myo-inositol 2-dehydrogenase 2 [Nitrospira sp.]|jgi:predicted dehydrogenase|nr:MAG: Myo-inositol 2-dehydrogenase 2 [Nitrospira sp.]
MKKLRFGVIGAGAFAETCHVPGLQSHPQAEVVVLCGRDSDRTSAMARRLEVPEISVDYQELCARKDIDAVTIATPNVFHAVQAQVALAAGKHVFCEKPLGMNVGEAVDMLRAAERSRKIHQVAFTYRYLYGVQELKRRLRSGDIGDPYLVRIRYESWDGLRSDSTVGFREKMNLAGGGVLYDVGSHLFDLVGYVIGPIQAVTGFTMLIPRERVDTGTGEFARVETDDIASAWFVCGNGVRGQLFASRATPCSGDKAYIEVVGSNGALKASLSRGSVDVLKVSHPARQSWEIVPVPEQASDGKAHCLPIMMRSFVDACFRGKLDGQVDASFHDGLAVQRALAAVEEASCRCQWIPLKTGEQWEEDAGMRAEP